MTMDQRIRKLMMMLKALHPWTDVGRQYVPRKEGGRGLVSSQDSGNASIQQLEDYTKKLEGRLITTNRSNIDNTNINRTKITRKQK